jgi:opacity protein-like surface antigen
LRLPILALAVLAFGLTSVASHAADLPPAPVLDDEDDALGSGWYLRGDVGSLDPMISRHSRDRGSDGLSAIVNGKLDRAFAAGAGLGYQFSPWFRADFTADHWFEAAFKGTRLASNGAYAVDRGDFDLTSFLVNGYVDLPLWSGITPYLGAGIGLAQIRFGNLTRDVVGTSGSNDTLTVSSHGETLLAWALMGGVGFDLTTNLKIDLGYRYSRLGGGSDSWNAPVRPRHLSAHEFRIGARYMFD